MIPTIIIIAIILIITAFFFGTNLAGNAQTSDKKTVFDAQQNYMNKVYEFLNREFSYEIHKYFSETININGANSSIALRSLADSDKLHKMITGMTINMTSRMSNDIKNAFYREYDRTTSMLTDFVSTWVFFKIRAFIAQISLEIQVNGLIQGTDKKSSDDIADEAMLKLEIELYKLHGIVVDTDKLTPAIYAETLPSTMNNGGR